MKPAFWSRKIHKWIGLVIGVQALLWMISGVYMTVVSLDVIHGDHLAHVDSEPLKAEPHKAEPHKAMPGADVSRTLAASYPGMQSFRLKSLLGRQVYEVHDADRVVLVDAANGTEVGPLNESQARRVAESLYQGDAPLVSIALLMKSPQEVASRPPPLWQAKFGDRGETTLYISPGTGELLAKRHSLWRWFDFLWMFHIMDYEAREDVNNTLLRVASSLGFVFALSGIWLLFYSFSRRSKP